MKVKQVINESKERMKKKDHRTLNDYFARDPNKFWGLDKKNAENRGALW